MSSKDWISVRSPRFEALFSTGGEPVRLLLPLPCPPVSTSPGEGLPGSLFEGSCGRCKRRSMPNRLNVGCVCPLITAFSKYEKVLICYPMAAKSTDWPSGETGAGGLAFCYERNGKDLREPERKGCLTPVELTSLGEVASVLRILRNHEEIR